MSLDEFLNHNPPIPDDIEDLKQFATAVNKKMSTERKDQLLEHFFLLSLRFNQLLDNLPNFRINDQDRVCSGIGLTCMVQLYKFLKNNERGVRELLNLGEAGEPFCGIDRN